MVQGKMESGVIDSCVTMEGQTEFQQTTQTKKKPCFDISSSFSPTSIAIRTKLFYLEEVTCGA